MPSRIGLHKQSKRAVPGPRVAGRAITGRESTGELIENAFHAFVGREIATAYKIIRRMIEEDHTIVLTLSGAMTPADLHTTCLIPLIRAGFIDLLTTTGANIYHDLQRAIDGEFFAVDPNAGDLELRKKGLTRIYDLVFPEDDLYRTDKFVQELVRQKPFQRPMTTPEFHDLLGRYAAAALQDRFGRDPLNVAYLKRKLGERFKFRIDIETDIHEFGAYHWLAKNRWSKKLSIIILGGGVPKNYSLQPEPYLSQICALAVAGYDCDVQICDAHVQNGGLSSCTAGEAHTWGKVSAEFQKNSQYVFAEVTSVFPFLVHALLQAGLKKKPRRLLDRRDEALRLLDKAL
jgi:deoxyhypusine synthase